MENKVCELRLHEIDPATGDVATNAAKAPFFAPRAILPEIAPSPRLTQFL
jgi:hypothetical protein